MAGSEKKKYGAAKKTTRKVSEAAAPYAAEPSIKKNIRLRQGMIDAARQVLGTSTETETIETALDLVVFRQELIDDVRALRGLKLVNYFDE